LELRKPDGMGPFYYTAGITAVAGCSQARRLRLLRLRHFDLLPDDIRALVNSPHLAQARLAVEHSIGLACLAPLRKRFGDRLIVEDG
jgi:hypothetical protein